MSKGKSINDYPGKFKQTVVEAVRNESLSYREAMRPLGIGDAERSGLGLILKKGWTDCMWSAVDVVAKGEYPSWPSR